MNTRTTLYACLVIAAVMSATVPALADDYNPPPWRGQPRTTFAQWEFDTSSTTPAPDLWTNPFGQPATLVTPGPGMGWLEGYNGRNGVWQLSGAILVDLQNYREPLERKDIYIQMTWTPQGGGGVPHPQFEIDSTPRWWSIGMVEESTTPVGGGWNNSTYHIEIYPNPSSERIRITGAINVDELVIDTRCIPEPATLSLLALGVLVATRRVRTRR